MPLMNAEELASYLQSDLDRATVDLLVTLTEGEIGAVVGDLDDLTASQQVRVKTVALEVVARAYRAPTGATPESVGSTRGATDSQPSTPGVYLTRGDKARLREIVATAATAALGFGSYSFGVRW